MKISSSSSRKWLSVFIILTVFIVSGFTKLSDIETAIIEKDFKTAKSLSEKFIKKYKSGPDFNQAQYYLGISEIGLAQYADAQTAFNKVLEKVDSKDSLYEKAWLGVIDTLGLEEKFEEDLSQAERFLKERPNSEFLSIIYLKIGRANLKLSRWETAEWYLKKLIHVFPNTFEAHTARQLLEEKRYFAIQVGSFLDRNRAIQLAEELKQKGEYAYLIETQDHEGNPFYRVRVGQLRNLDEARWMKEHLSSQGYPTHIYP